MSPRGWLLLVICAVVVVIANIGLRFAVGRLEAPPFSRGFTHILEDALALAGQPLLLGAVACYCVAIAIWLRVLATEPLSIAYPSLTSATFVAIILAGVLVFGEPWNLTRTAGVGLILVGLVLLSTH